MAKLYFSYSTMNAGKSTLLLQASYNYRERGMRTLLYTSALYATGDVGIIESRIGISAEADLFSSSDDLFDRVREAQQAGKVDCVLIDEAQFLTREQVDDLLRIVVFDGVPVLAYGIRTDFQTQAFPGSARLLELAHSLEELKTICRCGRKALFNARLIGGRFVFDGDQVAIDELTADRITYESLCAEDYLRASGGRLE